MWIEIFQAGRHRDSAGNEKEYSGETLERIASMYNSRTEASESELAPLVKGHPKTNDPAYGWVERLARRGSKLVARLRDLAPEISADVANGRFRKVSIALYPDLMLRHVGLLGAAAPAVKGLKPLNFDSSQGFFCYESDSGEVDLAGNAGSQFAELQAERDKLMDDNEGLKAEIDSLKNKAAELEGELRRREFSDFLGSSQAGHALSDKAKDDMLKILERSWQMDNTHAEGHEYSEADSMLEMVREFINSLGNSYLESELATGNTGRQGQDMFAGRNTSAGRMELHHKALNMQASDPALSYEEAISKIINK